MSNVPNIYLLQATRTNREMAQSLQKDMGAHFFEHAMYDVKDALSSILALCDISDMKELDSVKKYIQRVNDTISDVSLYHDPSSYNVKHVLLNVIKILERSYKSRLSITHRMVSIKAKAHGDQAHLEKSLLYMIIEAVESSDPEKELHLEIDLSQKDRDALITLRVDNFQYSELVRKELLGVANEGDITAQIFVDAKSSEVAIRIPLTFNVSEDSRPKKDRSFSLTLDEIRLKENQGAPDKEKALQYGAQERT